MAVGAAIGGAALLGYMGSRSAGKKAAVSMREGNLMMAQQMEKQRELLEKSVAAIEAIGIPSEEAQRIALQIAQFGPTALEGVVADPEASLAEYQTLEEMGVIASGDISQADRAAEYQITSGAGRQAQAREKAIMQDFQQRGVAGGGQEIMARLLSSQGAAERAAGQQAQLAIGKRQARIDALGQRGQLAGNIITRKYGQEANLAAARDRIEQFNISNKAAISNQQQMHNKALARQTFLDQMSKEQMIANARSQVGGSFGEQGRQAQMAGQAQAQGQLAGGQALTNLAGSGMMAAAMYGGKADGGVIHAQDGNLMYPVNEELFGKQQEIPYSPQPVGPAESFGVMQEDQGDGRTPGTISFADAIGLSPDESAVIPFERGMEPGEQLPSVDPVPQRAPLDVEQVSEALPQEKTEGRGINLNHLKMLISNLNKKNPHIDAVGPLKYAEGDVVGNPYLNVPNSNAGFADGGYIDDEYTEGGIFDEDGDFDDSPEEEPDYRGGELVPGESYAGDRVDAKVNSGEMVINLEQQQRLMDLLKGLTDIQQLGKENIIDQAPGQVGGLGGLGRGEGGAPPGPPAGGLPPGLEGLPPEAAGLPPMPPQIPEGVQPPMARGGLVPSEYRGSSNEYSSQRAWKAPRGIHENHASEKKQLEQSDGEQKHRKARIKALETLMNGGA